MNNGNQKHLTYDQRVEIEKGLTNNKTFTEIARTIGFHLSFSNSLLNARNSVMEQLKSPVLFSL